MSLLDFLRPKQKPTPLKIVETPHRCICDTNKTWVVDKLLKVPRPERDVKWKTFFLEQVRTAAFDSANSQVLTGPDGMSYYILNTPEPNKPFQPVCLDNLKNDVLLAQGLGVVFNPQDDGSAEWVFTHGDIVNLALRNEFYTLTPDSAIENIEFNKTVGVLQKGEQVMISQPSESYLPQYTRVALRKFLQGKGISNPKMAMVTSRSANGIAHKLALNIHPEDFPVLTKLDYLMQQVGWFLPNDYLLIPLSKKSKLTKDLSKM